jgi:hypothetical protein
MQVMILVVGTFVLHVIYFAQFATFGLSGDEAQYWEWSRNLDWSYYSKGPLVAYIIRASCVVFGETMLAVRLPAMVLAVGSSLATYWLVRRLFGSERFALGTVALTFTMPIFVLGSMMMTIDPPYFFLWGLATCLAIVAIDDGKRWAWVGVGLTIGVALLAKYAAPLWFVGLFAFLLIDHGARRWLKTIWPYAAVLIALSFFVFPLVWNMQNDWVTVKHVGRQLGVTQSEGSWYVNPFLMIGTQMGVVGPIAFVLMVLGAIEGRAHRGVRYLLCIGGTFFLLCLAQSTKAEIEPNWPAPTYFTMAIVAAWWIKHQLRSPVNWNPARWFVYAHVAMGVVAAMLIHCTEILYKPIMAMGKTPRQFDAQIIKMRGNDKVAAAADDVKASLGPGAFVMARMYQDASLLSFYMKGQPPAFHVGSYLSKEPVVWREGEKPFIERTRRSQWDIWPDRDLTPERSPVIGKDAVFVGDLDISGVIRGAFESIDTEPVVVKIESGGVVVREMKIWRCRGFKGIAREKGATY